MSTFFSLDIFPEDIANFKARGMAVVIVGSKLKGAVAIVTIVTDSKFFRDCTCYTPEEVAYLTSLDEEEALKVHELKRTLGGTIKPK